STSEEPEPGEPGGQRGAGHRGRSLSKGPRKRGGAILISAHISPAWRNGRVAPICFEKGHDRGLRAGEKTDAGRREKGRGGAAGSRGARRRSPLAGALLRVHRPPPRGRSRAL